MGAAYTALATDAYAPTWNPAGLGFLDSTQLAGQHLAYLESIHYEHLAYVQRLPRWGALGGSVQYLGTGDIDATNNAGNRIGEFSSYYAAYSLAYGQSLNEKLSLGLTTKWIQAKIDDASASAVAADLGALYKHGDRLQLAATVTNFGTSMKFIEQRDPLPLAFKVGGAYALKQFLVASEVVYRRTGLASFHAGGQWRPLELFSLRLGFKTDTIKELSAIAGLTTGFGVELWGHELAYAWLPFGDLGDTHSVSMLFRFGKYEERKRNLIHYRSIKSHRSVKAGEPVKDADVDHQQLMELIKQDSEQEAKSTAPKGNE
jgi:hypothetical protein